LGITNQSLEGGADWWRLTSSGKFCLPARKVLTVYEDSK